MNDPILTLSSLTVHLPTPYGDVHAVDSTSLSIHDHETVAVIGESGSGKSLLGQAITGFLPETAKVSGKVLLSGTDLLTVSSKEMQKIRGKTIASVSQSPYLALNPVMKVGRQIEEPMVQHLGLTKKAAQLKAQSLLRFFDIIPEEKRVHEYPSQFSGGMLQRVLIAMGMAAEPQILIADEPTKGIDVMKKRNVASLFRKVTGEGCALFLITHDIGLAKVLADRVAVNYCGKIIEIAETNDFFQNPMHPYSQALLNAMPENGMHPIPGPSPSMINVPMGCRYHPRCPYATDKCRETMNLRNKDGHLVRCLRYD